jgi:nucleotide-binding universal stress UspA family protein
MRCDTTIALSNVLLATDFSAESAQAVQCAVGLCDRYDAKLYVVHVLDLFPLSLSTEPAAAAGMEQIRHHADAQMKEFVRVHHLERKKLESALIAGEAATAIERFACEHEIDLLVLGSRGDAGLSRLFEGSMAEEIFRTAQCPVVVVGPRARVHNSAAIFDHLLFSTDLSRFSRAALPYVEFLLGESQSARLTLAHFLEEESTNVYERHQARRRLERELTEIVDPSHRRQIEDVVVEACPPNEGMLRMSEGSGADLLVLGVRSGGAFTRAATHGLCSIAPRIIAEASCPVLTVRTV